MPITVIARSYARDDVLLSVGDQWAMVHLTWSRRVEAPPWPVCVILASAEDVGKALAGD